MYFIKDKKYIRNPNESSRCPEASVGPKQRTVSCPQDRLRTGGPKTGGSPPFLIPYNSCQQLCLQLLSTTLLYRANYRLPRKIRLPSQLLLPLLLLPSLPRSSLPSEPRIWRSIISRIVNIVQEYEPSSAPSPSYHCQ
jgi:hypothetical protein